MSHQPIPQKHTSPIDSGGSTIILFVYGTLKRGFWNHDRFCRNAIDIRPATTWGRLYQLPAGYPALEVPDSAILAHGTADPLADATTQVRLAATLPPPAADRPPSGDWDLIHGELITFADPARDLPPIDRLEGFRPDERSIYLRVMVTAGIGHAETCPTWTYTMASNAHFPRLNGEWT